MKQPGLQLHAASSGRAGPSLDMLDCTTGRFKRRAICLRGSAQVQLQYHSLLQSTNQLLHKYNGNITKYCPKTYKEYKVLLQIFFYYKELCIPKYFCNNTKYYYNTNLYSEPLLQFFLMLFEYCLPLSRTTQVPLRFVGLLQHRSILQFLKYYSVLHTLLCTTPVLPCTTKYYLSTTL